MYDWVISYFSHKCKLLNLSLLDTYACTFATSDLCCSGGSALKAGLTTNCITFNYLKEWETCEHYDVEQGFLFDILS